MESLTAMLAQTLANRSLWLLVFAFAAGVVSSLLPCVISMLPLLIGYIGGYARNSKKALLIQLVLFISGLSLAMAILGVAAALLGRTFNGLIGPVWYVLIGILVVVMSLQLLEIIHLPLPQPIRKFPDSRYGRWLSPVLLGLVFGIAGSPCGTPFLAVILAFISREKNVLLGGSALFCYAMGQGVLLLVAGLFTGLLKYMAALRQVGSVMTKLSGVAFLLAGLLLIATGMGWLAAIQGLFT